MNHSSRFIQRLSSGFRSRIRWSLRGQGAILMFHRVVHPWEMSELPQNRDLEITPEDLESWIIHFKDAGFEFLSLDQVSEGLRTERRFVTFTFDDGYQDNLTLALPIFEKYEIPFALAITTSFPDHTAILWWYLFEEISKGDPARFQELHRELFSFSGNSREKYLKQLAAQFDLDSYSYVKKLALTWDEVRFLSCHPLVTIAAHSVSHPNLRDLPYHKAYWEIQESRRKIEFETSKAVRHFAYPFGSHSEVGERELEMVKELGFKSGLTTTRGFIEEASLKNPFSLPRVSV